jgi:DNA-binding NarL/FixJ family response regulator
VPELTQYEAAVATIRTHLDEDAVRDLWVAGRSLPLAEAIAEAAGVTLERAVSTSTAGRRSQTASAHAGLTPRELDVLRLIVAGHTDRQIAEALFISRRTAQGHVAAIFAKLGVNSRTAAATAAIAAGLVAAPPAK